MPTHPKAGPGSNQATFLQIDTHSRGTIYECSAPACNWWNILYCVMLTLGTAAAMLLAQPLGAGRLGCGSQPWQIMLVCYLRTLVLQLVNGLAVMVKIAWAFSFKGFLTWGVSSHLVS